MRVLVDSIVERKCSASHPAQNDVQFTIPETQLQPWAIQHLQTAKNFGFFNRSMGFLSGDSSTASSMCQHSHIYVSERPFTAAVPRLS